LLKNSYTFLAFLFLSLCATPAARASAGELHFRFIGNEAFLITDGVTSLLTDYPYQSGAFGYMTYDSSSVGPVANGLCLITHGHADHFDAKLFAATNFAIIAPPSVLALLNTERKIPFREEMTYRDIRVRAFRTPHGDIEHYSYLVLWHGLRLYFTGDTDDTSELKNQKDLSAAFVSPWLLERMKNEHEKIHAKRVVVYHHKPGEEVAPYQDRLVPSQGSTFQIPYP
jgi:L-ascorbate metabolism protein UlaG (beta-lactamase superfamily)